MREALAVRPVRKSHHSPDVVGPLKEFAPEDPTYFGLLLEVEIGPEDEEGADLFSLIVCSPSWLGEHALGSDPGGHRLLRSHLVLAAWNFQAVTQVVDDLCRDAVGTNWAESTARLSRYLTWEYEDYIQED